MSDETFRVSKLLTERGVCSRRKADEFISNGWVSVDGKPVVLGEKISKEAKIDLADEAQRLLSRAVTIILNKPVGYVSNLPEKNYKEALELLTLDRRSNLDKGAPTDPQRLQGLAVAGRLDIDSQGLIVFTQDGQVAKQLIGPESSVEKEYLVRVNGTLEDSDLELLRHGLTLDGRQLKPAKVEWINDDQLKFILREGRKRQIRRMCKEVGLHVVGLKRVRVGRINLRNLKEGEWRCLKPGEGF